MNNYALFVVAALVPVAFGVIMLFLNYQKAESSLAKKHGKRLEERARFSQIAAAEASEGERTSSSRKGGFGRR